MHGAIESLNAAVAGSILLYEAAAQRRLPEGRRRPPLGGQTPAPSDELDAPEAPPAAELEPAEPEALKAPEVASRRSPRRS